MRLKLISIVLLAGLMGYGGYWYFLSLNTGVFLEQASEKMGAQGVVLTYSSYDVSGFPYRLVVTFENPEITFQNGPLEIVFGGTSMEAIAQPWNLDHIIFFPENATIKINQGDKEIKLTPEHLGMSYNNLGNTGYRLSSELNSIEITSNLDTRLPNQLDTLAFHLRKEAPEIQQAVGLLEPKLLELALSGGRKDGLTFELTSSFRGQEVPKMTRPALEAWRNQGGTFEIDGLKVVQSNHEITGEGSFTLDSRFRPLGVFSINGVRPRDMLLFLSASQWANETEIAMLGLFLETLPKDPGGGEISLPLALSIQEGYLMLGPVRLKEVGPVISDKS